MSGQYRLTFPLFHNLLGLLGSVQQWLSCQRLLLLYNMLVLSLLWGTTAGDAISSLKYWNCVQFWDCMGCGIITFLVVDVARQRTVEQHRH